MSAGPPRHYGKAYGLAIASEFELPELIPGGSGGDLRIQAGRLALPGMHETTIRRLGIRARFGGTIDEACIQWPGIGAFAAVGGERLTVDLESEDIPGDLLNLYLLSEALGLVLAQRGAFLLHGSAVSIDGGAVVFVGPPGSGKSTLAAWFHRNGHATLTDDMIAVEFGRDDRPRVVPSFPEIALSPEAVAALGFPAGATQPLCRGSRKRVLRDSNSFETCPLPLRQIYFVARGAQRVSFEQGPRSRAFLGLARFFACPAELISGDVAARHFRQCERLLEQVSVCRVGLPRGFERLDEAAGRILEHLGRGPLGGPRAARSISDSPQDGRTVMNEMANDSMRSLLAPVSVEEFFTTYYEQRSLLVQREDRLYYAGILSADEIDRFFENTAIPVSTIRIHKNGKEYSRTEWGNGSGEVHNGRALQLFSDGATFIINSGDRFFPNLNAFCQAAEREMGFRVQPNIYITPFNAQGFENHYDDHDVFIMQVLGTKRWKLYHSPMELPSKRFPHKDLKGTYELGAPTMDVDLRPGDLLYIPRGLLHEAQTTESTSAHITFGLHPGYLFDLVQEFARAAEERPEFRRAIPNGLTPNVLRSRTAEAFEASLRELAEKVDVDRLMQTRRARFIKEKRPEFRHRFAELSQMNRLGLQSVLRCRRNALYDLSRRDRTVEISFFGKAHAFPRFLEPSLHSLLRPEPFRVLEIGGLIDDSGRIDLARKFVVEGLLEVQSFEGAVRA